MNVPRYFVLALLALGAWSAAPTRAAEHEGAGGAESQHHEAEESPQLLSGAKESMITALTTLIVFGALVVILGKTAWGPIAKGLQDREDKIRHDIEEAEAARARAEATQKEYAAQLATAEQKVRELLAKATADAETVAANIRMQADKEAAEKKEAALRDIDVARREAVRQVGEQAAMLATNVAEKILRRNLNVDDQRDLVAASLDQLQTVKG